MKSVLQFFSILILTSFSILFSKGNDQDALQAARKVFTNNAYVSYTQNAFYPIPNSTLSDQRTTTVEIRFDASNPIGFDYVQTADKLDRLYQNGEFRMIDHAKKQQRIYEAKHFKDQEEFNTAVKNSFPYKAWSPMYLLKEEWEYVGDTVINHTKLKNYYRISAERIGTTGKKIRAEKHIFIDQNALIKRLERRNYLEGSLSQVVVFKYSDYVVKQEGGDIQYTIPNYTSSYGKKKKVKSLQVGDKAPEFMLTTLNNNSLKSADFKGKKVLLNFSVISCGNCKAALDHMNTDDFILKEGIEMVYINPEDNSERLKTYKKSIDIPFQVVASAAEISQAYRVNAYPHFFLINEEGIIEKIQLGFSKEFLDEFRQ